MIFFDDCLCSFFFSGNFWRFFYDILRFFRLGALLEFIEVYWVLLEIRLRLSEFSVPSSVLMSFCGILLNVIVGTVEVFVLWLIS